MSETTEGTTGFSVFFRKDGASFGLYYNGTEYNLNDSTKAWGTIKSIASGAGLITNNEWNNYALRVDAVNMEVELFSGEWSLGTVDLTSVGMTTLDAKYIGYTVYGNSGRSWSDNFQAGTIAMTGVSLGKSSIMQSETTVAEDFRNGTTPHSQWYNNGIAQTSFTIKTDADNVYSEGSRAGSATGTALAENGHFYSTATNAYTDPGNKITVQMDAVLSSGGISIFFADDPLVTAADADAMFIFRPDASTSNHFGLVYNGTEIDISNLMTTDETLLAGNWYNFAVLYDGETNLASLYLDEEILGNIDISPYLPDGINFTYAGFSVAGANSYIDNFQISYSVPEPSSLALLLLGAGVTAFLFRRKKA